MNQKLCFVSLFAVLLSVALLPALAQQRKSPVADRNAAPGSVTFQKGVVLIKVASAYETQLTGKVRDIGSFGIADLDRMLQRLHVKKINQAFPLLFDRSFNQRSADNANRSYALKNGEPLTAALLDKRHRDFGFHLWYRLDFDEAVFLKGILSELHSLKGIIAGAELVPIAKLAAVFNDSLYGRQTNLHNTGQGTGIPGKDIDIERAWDITTGDSNVVVAVNESGVYLGHEDLQGSMWAGNGFNFFDDTTLLTSDYHATASASVIAARSNNRKGMSGIAGGNGTPSSGARIMSTQIFNPAWSAFTTNLVEGFVFSADNGVAISNNSWWYYTSTFHQTDFLYKDAVAYFTRYGGGAGTRGGLSVWSGGNENLSFQAASSSYDVDSKLVVAAVNNSDRRTAYSNYGEWIDICAPGGEPLVHPDNTFTVAGFELDANGDTVSVYGFAGGTSMAAPVVSGVAALVASVAPGRFTGDEVVGILLHTADNIDSLNPGFESKLGAGRVNAYKAVLKAQQMAAAPMLDTVGNIGVTRTCNGFQVTYSKNAAGSDVMIAIGLSRNFDLPHGRNYNPGDSIGKSAKVVYRGSATTFNINQILGDSAVHYIKIWSVSGTNYSGGKIVRTPYSYNTLSHPSAVQNSNSVVISFGKACPNSDVMVLVNSLPQFGKPTGLLSTGATLQDGGTVLYKGSASGFTHSNLSTGSYYYALYSVTGKEYGPVKFLGGFCFGGTGISLPVKTDFEGPGLPAHFGVYTNAADGIGWQVANDRVGHSGSGVAFTSNFFKYLPENMGEESYLQTERISFVGVDSALCRFSWYYHAYDTADAGQVYDIDGQLYQDTLALMVSADCGQTWQAVWKKWGMDLATVPPDFIFYNNEHKPGDVSKWKTTKLNLSSFLPAGAQDLLVRFRNTCRNGNNIYLDDINIYKVFPDDASLRSVIVPNGDVCSPTISPKVVIQNAGTNALTSVVIKYQVDGGPLQTFQWSGNLPYEKTDTVALPVVTAGLGAHTFRAFTSTPNSFADGNAADDSVSTIFEVISVKSIAANSSYRESFENPVPVPDGWRVSKSDDTDTWQRVDKYSQFLADIYPYHDTSVVMVITAYDETIGAVHDLYTPPFATGNADTVMLSFSRAAFAYFIPGNTSDRLEVLLTTDCGETFTTIYSETGVELTTSSVPGQYLPLSYADWRNDTIDVSGLVRNVSNYRFVFRVINGYENNVYLDNVQLRSSQTGTVLPATLLSFTGRLLGGSNALLQWRTATETGTTHFELERSADEGRSFSTVARIEARGGAQTPADYSHEDRNLKAGSYIYRLKMVDGGSGRSSYSGLVKLSVSDRALFTVYPNPASEVLHISVSGQTLLGKQAVLTDLAGRAVLSVQLTQPNQTISIGHLAKGTYLLKVGEENAVKVIRQ